MTTRSSSPAGCAPRSTRRQGRRAELAGLLRSDALIVIHRCYRPATEKVRGRAEESRAPMEIVSLESRDFPPRNLSSCAGRGSRWVRLYASMGGSEIAMRSKIIGVVATLLSAVAFDLEAAEFKKLNGAQIQAKFAGRIGAILSSETARSRPPPWDTRASASGGFKRISFVSIAGRMRLAAATKYGCPEKRWS
jgi:hypothetical protein